MEYELTLFDGSKATISIKAEKEKSLEIISPEEAWRKCEAQIQVYEGCNYEYEIEGFHLSEEFGVVKNSAFHSSSGRIIPGNLVGTLSIDILSDSENEKAGVLKLEVRSRKIEYREDYQEMLRFIADRCNELILKSNSPVEQLVGPVFSDVSRGLYQRFAFLRSILDSQEFKDAVNRVLSAPVSTWSDVESARDIRNVRRFDRATVRQIASGGRREALPSGHPLAQKINSVPGMITGRQKVTTVDTPENRFVKHALNSFLNLCSVVRERAGEDHRLFDESSVLINTLDQWLSNSLFRELGMPESIPLNSPVLQRKEGYREILKVWLMHDLASRVCWEGGENVYGGGKKNIAVLYEYWVFFKLLDIVQEVFSVEPKDISSLISLDDSGLNLNLIQGRHVAIKGVYQAKNRIMNIELNYNRTFSMVDKYPDAGSWTKGLRPDYTLSIWPFGLDGEKGKQQAEEEENIVHIHFDAKYRVKEIKDLLGEEPEEGKPLPADTKDADLMKMHAYRDAIRRSGGSYVIFPGVKTSEGNTRIYRGFREIIPGLGAFPLNPSEADENSQDLAKFLSQVAQHMMNRVTQREKMAQKAYQTYSEEERDPLFAELPRAEDGSHDVIPDETWVLVCYYKNSQQLAWIEEKLLYNARAQGENALEELSPEAMSAKYILLYGGRGSAQKIYPLEKGGPVLFSAEKLKEKGYPGTPSVSHYLVYHIRDKDPVPEFKSLDFKIEQLGLRTGFRGDYKPYPVRLDVLLRNTEPLG